MGSERGGEFRVQDLDRHLAVVLQVFREKHGGHAAATDLRVDPVAIGKRRADLLKQFGHEYPAVCAEDTWITTQPEGKKVKCMCPSSEMCFREGTFTNSHLP